MQKIGQWYDSVKESFVDVDFVNDLVEDDTVLIEEETESSTNTSVKSAPCWSPYSNILATVFSLIMVFSEKRCFK